MRGIEGIVLQSDFIPFSTGCLLFQVLVYQDCEIKRSSVLAIFNSKNFLCRENADAFLLPFH